MPQEHVLSDATFGYLSTWDAADHGCLGGYLIVSRLGRPLEFHCTAPVRTSRAQQILFGPTLWPYVLGEQIGGTLVAEAKLRPSLLLVNHPATLCLRTQFGVPMALLTSMSDEESATRQDERVSDVVAGEREFIVGQCAVALASGHEGDRGVVGDLLALLAENVALAEPFERIHEAIREAQRLGGRGQDAHEQAA